MKRLQTGNDRYCVRKEAGGCLLHGGPNQACAFWLCISAAISAWLTASHPNSEVKQVRAGVVLRWGTTREGPVLRFFCFA